MRLGNNFYSQKNMRELNIHRKFERMFPGIAANEKKFETTLLAE